MNRNLRTTGEELSIRSGRWEKTEEARFHASYLIVVAFGRSDPAGRSIILNMQVACECHTFPFLWKSPWVERCCGKTPHIPLFVEVPLVRKVLLWPPLSWNPSSFISKHESDRRNLFDIICCSIVPLLLRIEDVSSKLLSRSVVIDFSSGVIFAVTSNVKAIFCTRRSELNHNKIERQ